MAEFFEQTLAFTLRPLAPIEFVVETAWENLHLMASSPRLEEIHGKLESRYKIYKLRDALAELGERYDRIYVRRASMWLDLRLILLSFWISFRGTWESRGRKY